MKARISRLLFVASLFVAGSTLTSFAQDLGAVKARMEQRLSKVDALKGRGVIGENNKGMLEVRTPGDADATTVVADENKDRDAVYAALAKQTGSTAEAVGKARAKQIATASAAGVWVQKEDGAWARK